MVPELERDAEASVNLYLARAPDVQAEQTELYGEPAQLILKHAGPGMRNL